VLGEDQVAVSGRKATICRTLHPGPAIDQDAAHAHVAHVAKGDLLGPHAAIKAASVPVGKISIR
jgi:hypothetical protein